MTSSKVFNMSEPQDKFAFLDTAPAKEIEGTNNHKPRYIMEDVEVDEFIHGSDSSEAITQASMSRVTDLVTFDSYLQRVDKLQKHSRNYRESGVKKRTGVDLTGVYQHFTIDGEVHRKIGEGQVKQNKALRGLMNHLYDVNIAFKALNRQPDRAGHYLIQAQNAVNDMSITSYRFFGNGRIDRNGPDYEWRTKRKAGERWRAALRDTAISAGLIGAMMIFPVYTRVLAPGLLASGGAALANLFFTEDGSRTIFIATAKQMDDYYSSLFRSTSALYDYFADVKQIKSILPTLRKKLNSDDILIFDEVVRQWEKLSTILFIIAYNQYQAGLDIGVKLDL